MKRGVVEYPMNQGNAEAMVLRTLDDVHDYAVYINSRMGIFLKRLMDSGQPPDRWDHMITKTPEGGIFSGVLIDCKINEKSPLLETDRHIQDRLLSITCEVAKGNIVIVNDLGGYMPVTDDKCVISEWEFTEEKPITHRIVPLSKYINLENDESTEARTLEYFMDKGEVFSHINMLYIYSKEELIEMFREFIEAGGEIVHVYTTGMNVQQMYDYSAAAIDAGITKFEFEFCAGMNTDIRAFIYELENSAEVELICP